MSLNQQLMEIAGIVGLAAAAGCATVMLAAVLVWQARRTARGDAPRPPVTVLKPLCGAEPGLYQHLRSFCIQDYPQFQIVFGLRDPADPALRIAQRLVAEFPAIPIDVVVNPQLHGSNLKISSLINMMSLTRHDLLVIADSDTFVEPDYLRTVTAPLADARVGLVTSLYRGVPTGSVWSRLGAMYINDWYMPSVLLAWLFGHEGYVSGQTMCLRRDTLAAIGGLEAIADQLADDHRLGELVHALGLRVALSSYVPSGMSHEPRLDSLLRHELRWMRTIHVLRPRSFSFMFPTFSLPVATCGLLLVAAGSPVSSLAWGLFCATLVARLALHLAPRLGGERPLLADIWLIPVRDLLLAWVWCQAFFSSRVTWRGNEFEVGADGVMRRLS